VAAERISVYLWRSTLKGALGGVGGRAASSGWEESVLPELVRSFEKCW
jgi:hypothetical protein